MNTVEKFQSVLEQLRTSIDVRGDSKQAYIDALQAAFNQHTASVRTMVADYMYSEGCSCCRDNDAHAMHAELLALLLDVPLYSDGSGADFNQFRTGQPKAFSPDPPA